jgi:hypothetical protein
MTKNAGHCDINPGFYALPGPYNVGNPYVAIVCPS